MAQLFLKSYKKTAKRLQKKVAGYVEKRRAQRSSSNNTSNSDKAKNSALEIKDLSAVLNNIQVDSPGLQLKAPDFIMSGDKSENEEAEEHNGSVPSEPNLEATGSKVVYNQGGSDMDIFSILKNSAFGARSELQSQRNNSGMALLTPNMLQRGIYSLTNRGSLGNDGGTTDGAGSLKSAFQGFEKLDGLVIRDDEGNEEPKRPAKE